MYFEKKYTKFSSVSKSIVEINQETPNLLETGETKVTRKPEFLEFGTTPKKSSLLITPVDETEPEIILSEHTTGLFNALSSSYFLGPQLLIRPVVPVTRVTVVRDWKNEPIQSFLDIKLYVEAHLTLVRILSY